jgi:hypothetical protein
MIELNGLDEIADWLDQRELYIEATMIRRRQDEEAQGPRTNDVPWSGAQCA